MLGQTNPSHSSVPGSVGLDAAIHRQRYRPEVSAGLHGFRRYPVTIRGILLDIEGTTTPISFVYDVLFPFARAHAGAHIRDEDLSALRAEYDTDLSRGLKPPPWSDEPIGYVHWLMDQDRKSTALKTLQGKVWQEGYRRGELHGEVFPDVPAAL